MSFSYIFEDGDINVYLLRSCRFFQLCIHIGSYLFTDLFRI